MTDLTNDGSGDGPKRQVGLLPKPVSTYIVPPTCQACLACLAYLVAYL